MIFPQGMSASFCCGRAQESWRVLRFQLRSRCRAAQRYGTDGSEFFADDHVLVFEPVQQIQNEFQQKHGRLLFPCLCGVSMASFSIFQKLADFFGGAAIAPSRMRRGSPDCFPEIPRVSPLMPLSMEPHLCTFQITTKFFAKGSFAAGPPPADMRGRLLARAASCGLPCPHLGDEGAQMQDSELFSEYAELVRGVQKTLREDASPEPWQERYVGICGASPMPSFVGSWPAPHPGRSGRSCGGRRTDLGRGELHHQCRGGHAHAEAGPVLCRDAAPCGVRALPALLSCNGWGSPGAPGKLAHGPGESCRKGA